MTDQPFPIGRTTVQARHVRFGGRLVDEDKPGRVEPALAPLPATPRLGDVGPVLLGRMERLFLYVSPSLDNTQWIAPTVQSNPSRCLISSKVTSGSCSTSSRILLPCSGYSRSLRPQIRYIGLKSHVRLFFDRSFFTMPTDTFKRLSTSSSVPSLPT
jgi:hypothetical protein